jgi:phosphate acetyltransferase
VVGGHETCNGEFAMAEKDPALEHAHEKYQRLLDSCTSLPPTPTAVAHPCDQSSLEGAVHAARLGLISPILVGPRVRIEATARQYGIDLAGLPIVDAPFSQASAEQAVAIVREGKAEALMKGSLHTDELMAAVVKRDTGLRTARRVSHCFVMDVPTHPEPLIITDAAVNIAPTLEDKVDIVQNAIELAHALGAQEVRVAILSAMETVNPKVPSTIEAAALCKMAERGQITGGLLDGPLALDNAINEEAAAIKHIVSPVAGRAIVLVVPDLESGNMLAKSLSFLAGAAAAGIVLGARVPIILTSRADSVITRLASCAVASLVAEARRKSAAAAIR